jgi:hypothetical protein
MISLRSELEAADRLDRQKQELTRYYLSAIEICAKHAIEVPTDGEHQEAVSTATVTPPKPREARQAGAQLKALHNALLQDDSPDAITRSLAEFETCMNSYSHALRGALAGAH